MTRDDQDSARTDRLVVVGSVATASVVLAGAAAQLIGYGVFGGRIPALDSSADGGVFGIVGDVSLAGAACGSWVVFARTRPVTLATAALPPLLTFLAVDKAVRLHDHVHGWLMIYLPLLGSTLFAVVVVARRFSPRCARLATVGLVLLSVSFLIHVFGPKALSLVGASPVGWAHQIKVAVKHGAEVAGWLILALSFWAGLRDAGAAPHQTRRKGNQVVSSGRAG